MKTTQTTEEEVIRTGISIPSIVYAEAKKKSLASFGGNVSRYLTSLIGMRKADSPQAPKVLADNALEQLCRIYHPTLLPEFQEVMLRHPLRGRQDKLVVHVLQAFVSSWDPVSLATVSGFHIPSSEEKNAQKLAAKRLSSLRPGSGKSKAEAVRRASRPNGTWRQRGQGVGRRRARQNVRQLLLARPRQLPQVLLIPRRRMPA